MSNQILDSNLLFNNCWHAARTRTVGPMLFTDTSPIICILLEQLAVHMTTRPLFPSDGGCGT